ncbi:uncharacterized protein LOC129286473 [Prosopis cineraria]|uniref:uncharacterized protein LOC129286473 n=1 Tax=Prosopis cineraria TaxID=364024 RepID=UPI0024100AB3|nr:uncharacterized protein LOC129286473 [Prosopis cineraria]
MKEWLQEEQQMIPKLTEDQKAMLDNLPQINISNERLKKLCMPWKDAVIVTVLGRSMMLKVMREKIEWILKSSNFELIDLLNNYFTFGSEDKALSQKLLFEGPWLIQGHYLAVQRWSPNFNPYSNSIGKIAVWARVPTLPTHCYSEELMLELGNMCGKVLKVYMNTLAYCKNRGTMMERGHFARVSVEVDLNQRLKSKFVIRNRIYKVEYEGLDVV